MNLPTSEQVISKLKVVGMIVGGIIALIIIIVPGIMLLKYLNKSVIKALVKSHVYKVINVQNEN